MFLMKISIQEPLALPPLQQINNCQQLQPLQLCVLLHMECNKHLFPAITTLCFADSSQIIFPANSRFLVVGDEAEQLLLHCIFTDLFIHSY